MMSLMTLIVSMMILMMATMMTTTMMTIMMFAVHHCCLLLTERLFVAMGGPMEHLGWAVVFGKASVARSKTQMRWTAVVAAAPVYCLVVFGG